jgi:hypothetical protein
MRRPLNPRARAPIGALASGLLRRAAKPFVVLAALATANLAQAQDSVDDGSSVDPITSETSGGTDGSETDEPAPAEPAEPAEEEAAEPAEEEAAEPAAEAEPARESKAPAPEGQEDSITEGWDFGVSGYFRAPMAMGFSPRPGPDNPMGEPEMQISYGPNRTVDANYFSFAYTRLQETDWAEAFIHAKKKHVQATIGWMGYWFQTAGFRNPDAAWVPSVAYLTLDTDLEIGGIKPNIALSVGSWWPRFGRFEKYDTFTLGQYRQLGEQLKITVPFTDDIVVTLVQGLGTGRDGSFNILAPPLYQTRVGLNLIHYTHLQFNYKDSFELGLHHNIQITRDPNLFLQTSEGKSYTNARDAGLETIGAEVKVDVPYAGQFWLSPSLVQMRNGWALGEAGVEVVHGLSPEGLAGNYLGWSGSPADSTGSGSLLNLGFLYENSLSNVLDKPAGGTPELKVSAFGLLVDASLRLPEGSAITQDRITQFKWGADAEYIPWKWLGVMLRYDLVNYDMDNPGYIFAAITGRVSLFSDYLSGERIYIQYSRYRYGDNMVLAGRWPWGVPLIAGSDIIQGGVYAGSKPDMDVVRLQAEVSF